MQNVWQYSTVEHTPGSPINRFNGGDPFIKGIRHVVFIGRCLGIVSRNDVLHEIEIKRSITVSSAFSGGLCLYLFLNTLLHIRFTFLRFQRRELSTVEKLWHLQDTSFFGTMFFVYTYLLFATKRFQKVVKQFKELNNAFKNDMYHPHRFLRFCWVATIVFISLGIVENTLYELNSVWRVPRVGRVNSTFELYYNQVLYRCVGLISFHPVTTVFFAVLEKTTLYGCFYCDVFVIVLCKTITDKFTSFNASLKRITVKPSVVSATSCRTRADFNVEVISGNLRKEFLMLVKLTRQVQNFVAPLILACYGVNVFIILLNLFVWITPTSTIIGDEHYHFFEIFHVSFRIASVTYFAAEVHHTSFSILRTIQESPNELYSISLERIERTLTAKPVGIHLFGSFLITRKHFLSIISFLFATELVLLQTQTTSTATTDCSH